MKLHGRYYMVQSYGKDKLITYTYIPQATYAKGLYPKKLFAEVNKLYQPFFISKGVEHL